MTYTARIRLALATLPLLLATLGAGAATESQGERFKRLRREKAEKIEPYTVDKWDARMRRIEKRGFPLSMFSRGYQGIRPQIGGMPSGSGFAFGLGYSYGYDSDFFEVGAEALYSTMKFTQLGVAIESPTESSNRRIRGLGRAYYHDYVALRFYGLGNNSDVDDRTTYTLTDTLYGGRITLLPHDRVKLFGELNRLRAETDPGESGRSIDEIFDTDGIPGFGTEATNFDVYGATLSFNLRDVWDIPKVGAVLTLDGWRYEDRSRDEFDFTRWAGKLDVQVPLGPRNRRLAFRVRASQSSPDAGSEVPFYLMETIGGATTLRGYDEYRFRDRGNLLINLEYRWEVWTYVDFALFYDAGKVFESSSDLNFNDMHSGYGFGIRLQAPNDVFLNIDIAGSDDGYKFHISSGPKLLSF